MQVADPDALTTSGGTVWFTGLSGAGKTTVAEALHDLLLEHGLGSYLLDGDALRGGLNADLGFDEIDRMEPTTYKVARHTVYAEKAQWFLLPAALLFLLGLAASLLVMRRLP